MTVKEFVKALPECIDEIIIIKRNQILMGNSKEDAAKNYGDKKVILITQVDMGLLQAEIEIEE